ncbi:MFS domain-containing protein [Meloidogyne graminicola]|uniref:MFS domain-containing protein n=1 Tax=Meloidogyne graminicola TaxID=189291 RepID=A0A8S9ZX33_9BILA|nr:MFS domain-containing protein [Meloidogyne graminicola]
MVNIPMINKDSEWLKQRIDEWSSQPQMQKRLVLIVVSVALLLDNMLYMFKVIVPIIPKYLRDIHAYENKLMGIGLNILLANGSIVVKMIGGQIDYLDEEIELGWLFAAKALLQIFVNPFSGFIIDRIGYELPMIIGLIVMFSSTAIFALGKSYGVLFFARSLQGFGSAFADTSGLAMIADRFTEESERSAALGIAQAFISFGSLVAPPFGSILYSIAGKPVPFLVLSLVCLTDAFMVFWVIQPKARVSNARNPETGERLQGTPMWRLFMDPFIAVCSGALIMANISLAFIEPTITNWMYETMPNTPNWQVGMIWFPAFFPHVFGVYLTVRLLKKYPQNSWLFATIGLLIEGISCLLVPFMSNALQLIIPLSTICFGIALIDTSLLPMLGFLVDTRHVSVYGSVYAIADISYSLAYAFGPIIAGGVVNLLGFVVLNILIWKIILNVGYSPLIGMLRKVHGYENVTGNNENKQKQIIINKNLNEKQEKELNPLDRTDSKWIGNEDINGYQQQTTNFGGNNPFKQGNELYLI